MEAPYHGTFMESPSAADDGLRLFGNQLVEVHLSLREELTRIREDLAVHGTARPRDLRVHCLTFCAALTRHHSGEDDAGFPALAERFPHLRPVLDELQRDHHLVTDALRALQELLDGLPAEAGVAEVAGTDRDPGPEAPEARRVRAELDTLAALLETHFTYEERRVGEALNSLPEDTWPDGGPEFLRVDPA